jgi:TetR/AcrR family transcriptional regulator, transcriptional repressor of aconitase
MPRLTDASRLDRRTRIAEAALRCFARDGVANTSMADVIKESGLSNGAIYSHFASKADLLRFTVATAVQARFTRILEAPSGEGDITPGALLQRMLTGPELDPDQTRIALQVWGEVVRNPELAAFVGENISRLRSRMSAALRPWADAEAVTPADGEELALRTTDSLVTAMFGYATRVAIDPGADPEGLRDSLVATLTDRPLPTAERSSAAAD